MNKSKIGYSVFMFIFGIIVCLFFIKGCQKQVLEYWEVGGFETDTIYVDVPYSIIRYKVDSFPFEVPPKVVEKFIKGDTEYKDVKCDNDSLLILVDSLGWELFTIDKGFILEAPTSSKLISGFFTKKGFQLVMLNTKGETYSQGYKVNYNRFDYQYIDNALRAQPLKPKIFSKRDSTNSNHLEHGLYLSPGFSILDKKLTGSLDYLVKYGRIQGGLESRVTIEPTPQLILHAKVGLKLNK